MPKLPPKPCTHPSCKAYATKQGRCDEHQVKPWSQRATKVKRMTSAQWEKLRKAVMRRDSYLCQECQRQGIVREGKEADHIKPLSLGGNDSLHNLELLCKSCHSSKTAREALEARSC